jgi:hypothetical protein
MTVRTAVPTRSAAFGDMDDLIGTRNTISRCCRHGVGVPISTGDVPRNLGGHLLDFIKVRCHGLLIPNMPHAGEARRMSWYWTSPTVARDLGKKSRPSYWINGV